MEIDIKDNPDKHRFEITIEGHTAFIEYSLKPGIMTVLRTEVPKELEGGDIAGAMTQYALKNIAARNLKLVPGARIGETEPFHSQNCWFKFSNSDLFMNNCWFRLQT